MVKKALNYLKPPDSWRMYINVLVAIIIGMAAFLVYESKAPSYLSDDPKTCVNCHIMAPQYATYSHSSHRGRANCNDCHVPHNNVINKYYFKAKDGLRHASIFTLRKEPQVIFIHEAGREVVQNNCIRCHTKLLKDEKILARTDQFQHQRTERPCWDCHREVPHGRVNSLSSVPNPMLFLQSDKTNKYKQ
ncbi:MAG: cytochrome c nitrite reductase small subunit [Bacteroidales bacterium]|nr:cytochrome c nitrite reductase small subunit [Bacteroidales bacterium]